MARYLIHACNARLWYVNEYLIPSMREQGIDKNDINIYLDTNNDGCLESCMRAFLSMPNDVYGTWHLQDDVLICSDFKERTEEFDNGIVCGYCYSLDGRKEVVGETSVNNIWYSFPCIRIPNKIARGCADWYYRYARNVKEFSIWVKMKKYDDSMFEVYLLDYYPKERVLNLAPTLVDHIDYLIGGSVINQIRPEVESHSAYFKDTFLVDELENKLKIRS